MIVNLFSPDGSRQPVSEQLRHDSDAGRIVASRRAWETSRSWVSATTACGSGSIRSRWRCVTSVLRTFVRAIEQQNTQVAAGQIGQPPTTEGQVFQYTMTTLGRLTTRRAVRRHGPANRRSRAHDPTARRGSHGTGGDVYDQVCTLDTDSRRSRCRSINCRARMRWRRRVTCGPRWRSCEIGFPRGSTTRSCTTRRRSFDESVNEVFNSSARRGDPGGDRGAGVSAGLATGDHSAHRGAGGDRRHVRRHGWPSASVSTR